MKVKIYRNLEDLSKSEFIGEFDVTIKDDIVTIENHNGVEIKVNDVIISNDIGFKI